MRRTRIGVAVATLGVAVAACGGGDAIAVESAWARTSPMMATNGAVYMELTSDTGDRLIGATVGSSIAATVEVHETVMADHEGMSMGDDAMGDDMEEPMGEGMGEDSMAEGSMEGMGAMTMQEVEAIELPAGETVTLQPGGYHIMLLDLAAPLEIGSTFEVTLTFAEAGELVVEVEVRDEAP